jgi:hypothetical protein
MLQLHKIQLSADDVAVLNKLTNGDKIKWKEALSLIQIDLDFAKLDETKWTVIKQEKNDDKVSAVTSRALSRFSLKQAS